MTWLWSQLSKITYKTNVIFDWSITLSSFENSFFYLVCTATGFSWTSLACLLLLSHFKMNWARGCCIYCVHVVQPDGGDERGVSGPPTRLFMTFYTFNKNVQNAQINIEKLRFYNFSLAKLEVMLLPARLVENYSKAEA